MSKATTTRPINVDQLATVLGAAVSTRGATSLSSGTKEVEADVPQAVLDAAIAAHVAVNTEANLAAILAALDASMAALSTIAATVAPAAGNLTAAVLSGHARTQHAAIVQLAANQRRIIRVLRGDFTGTA